MRAELEKEKQDERDKKKKKGEEAARILEAKAQEEQRRLHMKALEQKEDVRLAELKKKQDEDEDARRQAEWDARAAKIARSMQYMANTVGKQVEEQERVAAEKLQRHLENKRK